jgi:uncharacterized protein
VSSDPRALVWRGLDAWRTEYAEASVRADGLLARGTQIGVEPLEYRVDYSLDSVEGFVTTRLTLDARGAGWSRRLDLARDGEGRWQYSADDRGDVGLPAPGGPVDELHGAIDCDLEFSPLFNSTPVLREGMLDGGTATDFVMAWVSVPSLAFHRSEQRYEPAGGGMVRFRSGGFTADLVLDGEGFVVHYPGLAERVGP